jgi:hypothetical protein
MNYIMMETGKKDQLNKGLDYVYMWKTYMVYLVVEMLFDT